MTVRKVSPTVFTPLDDGTAVVLNVTTLFYYSLNRTGANLWREIEEKKSVEFGDLIKLTLDRFDVSEHDATTHLTSFITKLAEFRLIETAQ